MSRNRSSTSVNTGLLLFGAVFGLLCAVLILAGVLGPTLWVTVVAMVLLVISQALTIRAKRRQP